MDLTRTTQVPTNNLLIERSFQGLYGEYIINQNDEREVLLYRISLLVCGISFASGLIHWILLGPTWAWCWFIPMATSLGLALNWIHIYLKPLHRALILFWFLGCIGTTILLINQGAGTMLTSLSSKPSLIWLIGPLFTSLTGIGFKEFFCFRKPEAIGLTIITPIALLGHLMSLLSSEIVIAMLFSSSVLMIVLAIRKFGADPAGDIGDKSVFDYLSNKQVANVL